MAQGSAAAARAVEAAGARAPADVFNTAAKAFLSAVGASCGPLYATAFMRAGAVLKGKDVASADDVVAAVQAMAKGIAERGKAELGEKTMVDAWLPAGRDTRQDICRKAAIWLPPSGRRPSVPVRERNRPGIWSPRRDARRDSGNGRAATSTPAPHPRRSSSRSSRKVFPTEVAKAPAAVRLSGRPKVFFGVQPIAWPAFFQSARKRRCRCCQRMPGLVVTPSRKPIHRTRGCH